MRRPFIVGMVHGLAGSAALMLLVLSTIESPLGALLYIVIFGLGSVGGMLLLSGIISLPFVLTAQRFAAMNRSIRVLPESPAWFSGFGWVGRSVRSSEFSSRCPASCRARERGAK